MAITVTSTATTKLLTELETVKRELGITDNTSDKFLWDLIHQATDFIVTYCGRQFARETVTETKQALYPQQPWMVLTRTPIISISGVSFNGSTVSSTTYTIEDPDAGLVFRETGWTTTQIYDFAIERQPTNWGRKEWSFTYTAGYICPGSTVSDRTLPYDLERACIDLIKWRYNQQGDFNPGIKRQRTGDASEEYFGPTSDDGTFIPPTVSSILDRYRRVFVTMNE